jgi:hypothetical protein
MKLLKEEKNWQQITKEAHVSCSLISMVKKKMLGNPAEDSKKLSIPSQALKLFLEGKTVLEVTIELDRPLEEIHTYYEDYLDIKKLSDLMLLIEFHQENLPTIKKMIRFILSNPVSKNDLLVALALATDTSRLRNVKEKLEEKIKELYNEREYLLSDIYRIKQENNQYFMRTN